VGVELVEHASQGVLKKLLAIDGTNVVGFDLLDGVDEEAVKLHHVVVLVAGTLRVVAGDEAYDPNQGERGEVSERHVHDLSWCRWLR
jgi:hypothetical protein